MTNPQTLKYNTLDVFTTQPFSGNQLGLVHAPASLPQETKQLIAIEFNYSETVILHQPEDSARKPGVYSAQIFTPKSELPFAGHPTIGTAVWIFDNLAKDRDTITINLKAGPVEARYDRATGIATAAIPHNVHVHTKGASWGRVAWSQKALADAVLADQVPIVSPVDGMVFALVDLSQRPELLQKVIVTKDDIPEKENTDAGWGSGLLGNDFYVIDSEKDGVLKIRQRVMVIDLEDPATGAASVTLAAYLSLQRGGSGKSYKFEIDQGIEMGRASKIFVDVRLREDGKAIDTIELSGQAVEVMSGELRVRK